MVARFALRWFVGDCVMLLQHLVQLRFQAPHSGQPEVLGLKALQPHQALNLRGVLGVLVEHAFNSRFATLKHIETNAELQIGLDDTLPTGMICHDSV